MKGRPRSAATQHIVWLQERVLTLEAALVLIRAQGGGVDHSACPLQDHSACPLHVCPIRVADVALKGKAVRG